MTQEKITPGQLACIKTIVTKRKMKDVDAMVLGFSGMKTTHVSDLSFEEAKAMIKHLKGLDPKEAGAERMRRNILAMAYERAGLPRNASREQKKAALDDFNAWALKYSYLKKTLDEYTAEELPKLVSQYKKVYTHFIENI